MDEYPQREIYYRGQYINCQILNWDKGPPPQFIVCHPLEHGYPEEFLAHQAMGTWMHVDLVKALRLMAKKEGV